MRTLKSTGARRVLDLGCGSGSLLYRMLADPQFESITGLEDSGVSLQQARAVLAEYLCEETPRIRLVRGSYAESNPALTGYDAAAMVETIEHVRPEQLSRVERAVFGEYRPGYLFMTTPNREYNPCSTWRRVNSARKTTNSNGTGPSSSAGPVVWPSATAMTCDLEALETTYPTLGTLPRQHFYPQGLITGFDARH